MMGIWTLDRKTIDRDTVENVGYLGFRTPSIGFMNGDERDVPKENRARLIYRLLCFAAWLEKLKSRQKDVRLSLTGIFTVEV